jgi:hypothetical protein
MTGLGIAVWALSATLIASLVWSILNWRRRRMLVGLGLALAAIIGLVVVAFAGMGAFCVPPPGAACL